MRRSFTLWDGSVDPGALPPPPPTMPDVVNEGSDSATINVPNPGGSAVTMHVYVDGVRVTSGNGVTFGNYTVTGLSPSTSYSVRVTAVNASGVESAQSVARTVTTAVTNPGTFDFYISPTGTGSASTGGTLANPWPISMLNDATARTRYAGKRVGLLDGTYNLYDAILAAGGVQWSSAFLNVAGGTAPSPTIIESVSPRQARLVATGPGGQRLTSAITPAASGGALIGAVGATRSFITLRGLYIGEHWGYGVNAGASMIGGNTNEPTKTESVVIENCEFNSLDTAGAAAGGNPAAIQFCHTRNVVVRNCKFVNIFGIAAGNIDQTSCVLAWDTHDPIIEFNTATSCKLADLKGYATCRRPIVRYNFAETHPGTVSTFMLWDDLAADGESLVHNNVFRFHNGFWRNFIGYKRNTVRIYNNTFVQATQNVVSGSLLTIPRESAGQGTHFFNNIIVRENAPNDTYDLALAADTWATLNHNCYSPLTFRSIVLQVGTEATAESVHTTLASWRTRVQSSLAGAESASIQANPLFTGTGTLADRFKLQAGSPCLAAASDGGQMGAWGNGATRIGSDF